MSTTIKTGNTVSTASTLVDAYITSNVTGIILQQGASIGQVFTLRNANPYTISFNMSPVLSTGIAQSNVSDIDTISTIPTYTSMSYIWDVESRWRQTGSLALTGQTHQEITGTDPLVNYGLFERIRRVVKTTSNATPSMFSGVANNADNTLQAGHGWTASNNGAGSLNYTGDFIYGTQCIKLTSVGNGATQTICTSPRETAVNLTGKMIRIWLKLDSASYSNLGQCLFYVGSGATQFLNFGNVQFAFSGQDQRTQYMKSGEWVCWTLNPASILNITGTIDWTALQDFRVSIKDNGSGPATVLFGGIDFIPNDGTYPNGVVSFTFDDSYTSQFTLGRTKLEQYGYKGTYYLIYDVLDTQPTLYMTKAQVDQLNNLGHDIGFHSHYTADHNATGGFAGITQQQLMFDWGQHKGWFHSNGYRGIEHMALPQGMFDSTLLSVSKQQFAAVRTTYVGRVETLPVADPYRLCAFTPAANGTAVTPNSTVGTLEWYLDQIFTYGGWMIFFVHDIVASSATGNQTLQSTFNTLVDYVATKGIPVRTVGDVLGI